MQSKRDDDECLTPAHDEGGGGKARVGSLNMATFYSWLMGKLEEPDPLGTLARDAKREPWWPYTATTLRECERFLKREMDPLGLPTLRTAWADWKEQENAMPRTDQ